MVKGRMANGRDNFSGNFQIRAISRQIDENFMSDQNSRHLKLTYNEYSNGQVALI